MASLPTLSGKEVVRAFVSDGWRMVRQQSSHMIMVKQGRPVTLSVPNHNPVAIGTLRKLIRASGMTVEEFVEHARS